MDINDYGISNGLLEPDGEGGYTLTGKATSRQDEVDGEIHALLNSLVPTSFKEGEEQIEWDIAVIAEVREVVQSVIYDKLKLKEKGVSEDEFEMNFYPFFAPAD